MDRKRNLERERQGEEITGRDRVNDVEQRQMGKDI